MTKKSKYKDPDYMRKYSRLYHTGWTAAQFEEAWSRQHGRCAICSVEMLPLGRSKTAVAADHCHVTGKTRSLLCRVCNNGIGHFYDDPVRLRAAAIYLEQYAR